MIKIYTQLFRALKINILRLLLVENKNKVNISSCYEIYKYLTIYFYRNIE